VNGVAATSAGRTADLHATGVGLRLPHIAEVAAAASGTGWFEIHPENFIANPHARELLQDIARRHAVALHTVGVSIGSATGLDRNHLGHIRRLADELDAVLVSGHLAWSTHRGVYLNDLLPLPYTEEALRVVAAHVREVQDTLGQRYLVENPASYVGFAASTLTEAEFLAELVARTGCRLLCDVSNAYLSAANMGYDAYDYIDALPADAVAELHLGGFTREADDGASRPEILIDTHADAIAEPVWDLYAHALRRFGSQPTLIEWDNELPSFARLRAEADRADAVAAAALDRGHRRALAR
jgi:uncharacterized protein